MKAAGQPYAMDAPVASSALIAEDGYIPLSLLAGMPDDYCDDSGGDCDYGGPAPTPAPTPAPASAPRPEEPLYESVAYWYSAPVHFPKAARLVFDDPVAHAALCGYCRGLANLVVDADGWVSQVFCGHCCCMIGDRPANRCHGGSARCVGRRFVSPRGEVAHLCTGCHQAAEATRRAAAKASPRARAREAARRRPAHLAVR